MTSKQEIASSINEIGMFTSLKIASLAWKVKHWNEYYVQGFVLKNTQWVWTAQQVDKLKSAIADMSENTANIPVRNWSYYIAHYIFDGLPS